VDIGGTKILLLLVDEDRNILFRERYPTPKQAEPEEMIRTINSLVSAAIVHSGYTPEGLAGLGVCIAAMVDFEQGVIHQAPNLGWHEAVPFKHLLEQNRACPVFMENDANAAVLGEVSYGSARGHRHVVYITISTGIGGGLYLDGKVFRGSRGFAGEIGHIKPFGKGRRCGCGGMDCLECWASGEAIARNAVEMWAGNESAGGKATTAWVFEQALAGNPLAGDILAQAVEAISTGLANLVTVLNPSCLVIGGGVVNDRSYILEQIRARVYELAIAPAVKVSPVEITAAQLGREAGVWGMYALICSA
jgi:glucokinase